mgnify:CR=1 FL=1
MVGRLRRALTGALVVGILLTARTQGTGSVQAATDTTRLLSLLPAAPPTPQDRVASTAITRLARLRTALDYYVGTGRLTGYEPHIGDGLVVLRGTAAALARVAADLQTPLLPDDASGRAAQAARYGPASGGSTISGTSAAFTANATIAPSAMASLRIVDPLLLSSESRETAPC